MEGTLIKLNDIRRRPEVDFLGEYVEVDTREGIYRGLITDFSWWKNGCVRRICWSDNSLWLPESGVWKKLPELSSMIEFDYEDLEHFTGPLCIETGEMFFMVYTHGKVAVTLFTQECELPHTPRSRCFRVSLLEYFKIRPRT